MNNNTSIIFTIFNEKKNITLLLRSILDQSVYPNEVVIVDGGSSDNTAKIVRYFIKKNTSKIKFRFYVKKGNRSVGRNEAIRKAKGETVLITDAGCILDKNWVKNITKLFQDPRVDVVAGYYRAKAKTVFQKCLTPYVLVMPDKVDPKIFLPATRSMAIRKKVWKELGGFDERYSHNEDYVFANKLRDRGKKIVFRKDAIVYWIPRSTVRQSYTMFRRFAYGDIEANIIRDKVLLIFVRYLLLLYFAIYAILSRSYFLYALIFTSIAIYIAYSIQKNIRYVEDKRALYILPFLQVLSDLAVMHGSSVAFLMRLRSWITVSTLKRNAVTLTVVLGYLLIVLPLVTWGIPNPNHPFFYHMDEWHGMQSIRYLFSTGTSNVEGAAYGMLFFYFLSGLFLVPFILIGFLDPFAIKSTVGSLAMQERLASILRLSTIVYGVGSIFVLAKIITSHVRGNIPIALLFFVISPIWLTLSTYFKYDIAVVFWILLSILSIFNYGDNPSRKNLMISTLVSGLAVTIKISALPIFGMLVLAYFIFTPNSLKLYKRLAVCVLGFFIVILLFGTPDIRTHSIDYYNLLHLNMAPVENNSSVYGISGAWSYLAFKQYPLLFGTFLYAISVLSFIFIFFIIIIRFLRDRVILKKELLMVVGIVFFICSLITLGGLGAGGNRPLVLLPFLVIILSQTYAYIHTRVNDYFKKILITIFVLGILLQAFQSSAWMSLKYQPDPRSISSSWIIRNVPSGATIGIENIPIYEMLPDIVVKEFYTPGNKNRYKYEVIDANTKKLPSLVIVSGGSSVNLVFKKSTKIDLVNRLRSEGYVKINQTSPDFRFYNLIGTKGDFFLANVVPVPTDITIYKR